LREKEKRSGSRGVGPIDVVIIIRRNRMRLTDEGPHAFGKRKKKEKRRRRRYYKQHTSEKSKEKREADDPQIKNMIQRSRSRHQQLIDNNNQPEVHELVD
jgi:hypothetical protein